MMRAINVGRQELGPDALATLGQLCNISVDPHLGQATVSMRVLGSVLTRHPRLRTFPSDR